MSCPYISSLRQRWLSFSSQLTSDEVELLLEEVGLSASLQQQQQQMMMLLLVQHADQVIAHHVELEAPELILAVFTLARTDSDVLEVSTMG